MKTYLFLGVEHMILAMQQADCTSVIRTYCPTAPLRRAFLLDHDDDIYKGRGECRPLCLDCRAIYYASCIKEVFIFTYKTFQSFKKF